MSVLEPEEVRYVSISAFGLIVYTTLLSWMGELQTADVYSPSQPDTSNVTALNQTGNFDGLTPSGGLSGPIDWVNTVIDFLLGIITLPIDIVVTILLTWQNLYNIAGFASGAVIVPMFIMIVIIIGALFKFISVLPTT